MERLNEARSKIDEFTRSRERLAGELDTYQKQLGTIETECQEKFEAGIDELAEISESLEAEANDSLAKAEKILGL